MYFLLQVIGSMTSATNARAWPRGYQDQVDAAAGAFNRLASGMYCTNYDMWL